MLPVLWNDEAFRGPAQHLSRGVPGQQAQSGIGIHDASLNGQSDAVGVVLQQYALLLLRRPQRSLGPLAVQNQRCGNPDHEHGESAVEDYFPLLATGGRQGKSQDGQRRARDGETDGVPSLGQPKGEQHGSHVRHATRHTQGNGHVQQEGRSEQKGSQGIQPFDALLCGVHNVRLLAAQDSIRISARISANCLPPLTPPSYPLPCWKRNHELHPGVASGVDGAAPSSTNSAASKGKQILSENEQWCHRNYFAQPDEALPVRIPNSLLGGRNKAGRFDTKSLVFRPWTPPRRGNIVLGLIQTSEPTWRCESSSAQRHCLGTVGRRTLDGPRRPIVWAYGGWTRNRTRKGAACFSLLLHNVFTI